MSDGTFLILAKGRTIYEGGEVRPQTVTRRGRRTSKTNGEIIYPIFKEAAVYTDGDSFWNKILEDASRGYFQRMYRYTDGTLSYKQKTKVFSKEICQYDPQLCLKNVQEFMKSNGCHSSRDHMIQMMETEQKRNEASQTILDWKSIKSRKTKKLLISKYIAYLGEHYSLNRVELSKLINLVKMANSIGLINSNTVEMINNQISDIEILCFDKFARDFFIDADFRLPKISKAMLKKINEESSEAEETEESPIYNIKSSGVTISKSRTSDWAKFTTILGKRMAVHNKLEEIKEKIITKENKITPEEDNLPLKINNPKIKIVIKSRGLVK